MHPITEATEKDYTRKVRLNGRGVSQAVVIATGISADGRREVLDVGDSDSEPFWTEFLRSLRDRGLAIGPAGVRLVVSDQHRGLTAAIIAKVLHPSNHSHAA